MTASGFLRGAAVCLGLAGLIVAPAAAWGLTCVGTASETRLILNIEGVQAEKGLMTASLYPDDKKQFLLKNGVDPALAFHIAHLFTR